MALKVWIGFFVFFLSHSLAFSAETFEFRVMNSGCSLKVQKNKKWLPSSKVFKQGTMLVGKKLKSDSDIVVFKTKDSKSGVYAANYSCLVPRVSTVQPAPAPIETPVSAIPTQNITRLNLSLWSWQEMLSSRYGSNSEIPLRATTFGTCPGVQFSEIRNKIELGISTCFLYAKSQISDASEDTVQKEDENGVPISNPNNYLPTYKVRNVDVFGFLLAPSWYYRPMATNVAIGVQIPLMARYVVFVETQQETSFTFSPRFWLLTGLMMESRFEWDPFYVSQKMGFFNKPSSFSWAFEAGYNF
jgi:hypothetical protein